MTQDPNDRLNSLQRATGSLALLAFGLAVLAFLVAIEHQNWFSVRPATGTARAMSLASDRAAVVDTPRAVARS